MRRYADAPDLRIKNLASLYLQHIGVPKTPPPPAESRSGV